MSRFQEIALFLIVNILGYFSPGICYHLGVMTGAISLADPNFDAASLPPVLTAIMWTWLVCAVFSFTFFMIRDNGRYIFLLAPLVVPVLYGLSAL